MKKRLLFISVLVITLFIGCEDKNDSPTTPSLGDVEIGTLELSQDGILKNTSTGITIKINVASGVEVVDSMLSLITLDASNNSKGEIGKLYDNGDLFNGDDIAGDNIFSGVIDFNESVPGVIKLQAIGNVKTSEGQGSGYSQIAELNIFSDITSGEEKEILNTQDEATDKFAEFLNGNVSNAASAVSQTIQWLQQQPQIEEIVNNGNTSIQIKYKSGLYGGIFFSFKDANGTVFTRGGKSFDQNRKKSKSVPLAYQTRGKTSNKTSLNKTFSIDDLDPKVIGNRRVLIFAPYEAAFAPYNERVSIKNILNSTEYKFAITEYVNQSANVAALNDLTSYGFVVLATHGSLGEEFATGEVVDTNAANYKSLNILRKAGSLSTWDNVTISSAGGVDKKETVYVIRPKFISSLSGKFPNSVILNNSCESTMKDDLYNAFKAKGAKTYFGYSKVVNSDFCMTIADTVTKRLAKDLKNTGETYYDKSDPNDPFAHFEIRGENDIHYTLELMNGDFEFGNLDGWTTDGDGRNISKLSYLSPTGGSYMGIISTGLGYTTSTGKIFQSFRVNENQSTIKFKWNFLSEEFLEFINSSFQDYFKVTIIDKDSNEDVLINKTIDILASEFGAQKFNNGEDEVPQPGNLKLVSPDIVFDRADVYMTDWQTYTFDITNYRGKIITIEFSAGDVGDSIYDTAILLDDISVQ